MNQGPDRLIIGRYALYDVIASGGMATVHLGQLLGPVGFARVVAIKRLHEAFGRDPEFVSAFLDEARLAARIRHPNVVPTLDVVAAKGELFVVMEYVHGVPLAVLIRALLDRGERIPAPIVASILSGALQGLHAAHEATNEQGQSLDIVHRDVSPQNIIVGADGTTRVLDFGIAKAIGMGQTTREGSVKGKIPYMSPEQIRAGRLTRQSDIYAASVVLWETLTCKRLFKAETESATFACVMIGEVRKPSEHDPTLAPFDEVVMKGLARRPADRFATAREMALAVERCAGVSSAAEVAEWLEQTVGSTLSQHTEAVAAIESSTSDDRRRAMPDAGAARSGEPAMVVVSTNAAASASPGEEGDAGRGAMASDGLAAHASAPPSSRRPTSRAVMSAGIALAAVLAGAAVLAANAGRLRVESPPPASAEGESARAVAIGAPSRAADPEQVPVPAASAGGGAEAPSHADEGVSPPPSAAAASPDGRAVAARATGGGEHTAEPRARARAPAIERARGATSPRATSSGSSAGTRHFDEIGGRQ